MMLKNKFFISTEAKGYGVILDNDEQYALLQYFKPADGTLLYQKVIRGLDITCLQLFDSREAVDEAWKAYLLFTAGVK